MKHLRALTGLLLYTAIGLGIAAGNAGASRAWSYPGIPYTDWGYDPFMIATPTKPLAWPSAQQSGNYFVAKSDPNATDTVDGNDTLDAHGKRWGYPNRPRLTLPLVNWNNGSFPAGTKMWISGGSWDSIQAGSKDWFAQWQGTPEAPCWLIGDPDNKPVFRDLRIAFDGANCHHVIAENLVWDTWTTRNASSVSVSDGAHHITVRHCLVQNRDYQASHGSHFAITSRSTPITQDCHDLVFYDIDFKNNGRAIDWRTQDADFHAFKPDGIWGGGRVYRMWVIGCHLYPGDTPDPIDGFYKSVSGTFIQVGDQMETHGNVDHVYVGGNVTQFQRQSVIGCKRCADVIGSGNIARAGSGLDYNMFNVKYDRQDHLWFIANRGDGAGALLARKGELPGTPIGMPYADFRVYAIGNISRNSTYDEQSGGMGEWKKQGVCFEEMRGRTYIVNNTMDNTVYGVVTAQNSRIDGNSEIHIYNNVFTNMKGTIDPNGGTPIMISRFAGTGGNLRVYIENNMLDVFKIYLDGSGLITVPSVLNSLSYARGNRVGQPMFVDAAKGDYSLQSGSPAIDAGTTAPATNTSISVYQQFIDRYSNDPDFPDNPRDVLPFDILMHPRISGSAIDCGALEYTNSKPPAPKGLEYRGPVLPR